MIESPPTGHAHGHPQHWCPGWTCRARFLELKEMADAADAARPPRETNQYYDSGDTEENVHRLLMICEVQAQSICALWNEVHELNYNLTALKNRMEANDD